MSEKNNQNNKKIYSNTDNSKKIEKVKMEFFGESTNPISQIADCKDKKSVFVAKCNQILEEIKKIKIRKKS